MRIDVALVPAEARRWTNTVCILLDELRASSTIVRILERGAVAVIPAASLADARRLARADGSVLAGEHRVVRAPGFDYGNSPAEVAAADLAGRTVVLATRNGTAVLRALPAGTPILVGCLLNATAVARAALALAAGARRRRRDRLRRATGAFALDDAVAAGAILERLLAAAGLDDARPADRRRARRPAGTRRGQRPTSAPGLTDAARAALQLWRSTPDVEASFRASWSGHLLAGVDLLADIEASLPVDAISIVPVVRAGHRRRGSSAAPDRRPRLTLGSPSPALAPGLPGVTGQWRLPPAPARYSSTPAAARRPSRIAQTTSDWPRRQSPAAKTPGTRRLPPLVGHDVAAGVERAAEPLRERSLGAAEAEGEEDEVGREGPLRPGLLDRGEPPVRPPLPGDVDDLDAGEPSAVARDEPARPDGVARADRRPRRPPPPPGRSRGGRRAATAARGCRGRARRAAGAGSRAGRGFARPGGPPSPRSRCRCRRRR